eukprot:Transcript_32152.p2 GENE.Transcript_32152~~Transcript_32152.p2  ORF type:complete len:403 (+),score=119.12 Transcript_32152:91-1299(+)
MCEPPLRIAVVIVTAFPPELAGWIPAVPLGENVSFPQGFNPGQPVLHLNRSLGVLGITTGMWPMRASASLTALGNDDRFDLRTSHWIVAGIAGIDPTYGSIGSVFFANFLVYLGGGFYLDGLGHVPRSPGWVIDGPDYDPPYPSAADATEDAKLVALDAQLVEWAHGVAAAGGELPDTPRLQSARQGYTALDEAPAREPPAVRFGDSATGEIFWAGKASTQWARNQTRYWSAGRATFAVTQEEDVAFAQALGSLDRVGRANASRLIVMRSASDYCYAPDGAALQPWFFHDDTHMAGREAFDALVVAGLPVVRALAAAAAGEATALPPLAAAARADCVPAADPGEAARQRLASALAAALSVVAILLVVVLACLRSRMRRSRTAGAPSTRTGLPVETGHIELKD